MDFNDLKIILVPTDLSDSSAPALRAAVQLAQTFHASIEVFRVDIDRSLVLPPPIGRSHAAIVEQARRTGAGLIVMGSHGRHGLSHALAGSVAEKVVQHAPCAVLVVPVSAPS